jgi:hypothetical protein
MTWALLNKQRTLIPQKDIKQQNKRGASWVRKAITIKRKMKVKLKKWLMFCKRKIWTVSLLT